MKNEFTFTWEGAPSAWTTLQVSRFEAREAVSEPYLYELTLVAEDPASEVDPEDLIGKRASLRLATTSTPGTRVVHGIVADAREVGESAVGVFYRVTLAAPLARAGHVQQSRIFLGKTPRQIVEAVLKGAGFALLADGHVEDDEGGPGWTPPEACFTWRIVHPARLDDPRVRSYTVQYDESDLAFVSRLLEAEGIGYHVENGAGKSLLVLSDDDTGKARLTPDEAGAAVPGRAVTQMALGARMRPGQVTVDDYNWKKPRAPMSAVLTRPGPDAALTDYVYPGGYPDSPAQGKPLGQAILDRYQVEADYALGEGSLRVLSAGSIFKLVAQKPRYEGEYLVTALEITAEQSGAAQIPGAAALNVPFKARFECARRGKGTKVAESHHRPARLTPWPRIRGAQTAVVTAEPGSSAEVDVGGPDGLSTGCVRVKFHWDTDTARHAKEPTSCWVRVSQAFAGAGQGAVWHPRVGVEVIVEHENGDPDRPLVTGRVYNGKNRPPYDGAPPISTFKSFSTPGAGTFNEFKFDDTAGGELLYFHAGKDMTTVVVHDRSENVGASAEMHVGVDNTENIGVDLHTQVGSNDAMDIGANRTKSIGANRTRTIGGNHDRTVGANETRAIGGAQTNVVGGTLTETIGGALTETYLATQTTHVTGAVEETFSATREVSVGGLALNEHGGEHALTVHGGRTLTVNGFSGLLVSGEASNEFESSLTTNVGSAQLVISGGGIEHRSTQYTIHAPLKFELTGISLAAHWASVSAKGLSISITGLAASATGISLEVKGPSIHAYGAHFGGGGPKEEPIVTKIRLGAVRVTTTSLWIFI